MKLVEVEKMLIESFDIEYFKKKSKEVLTRILKDTKSEIYIETKEGLSKDIGPYNLVIEYDSSALHFDHSDGNGPFIRLKYLLYLPNETVPEYRYDIDIDGTGVILDDYFMKW